MRPIGRAASSSSWLPLVPKVHVTGPCSLSPHFHHVQIDWMCAGVYVFACEQLHVHTARPQSRPESTIVVVAVPIVVTLQHHRNPFELWFDRVLLFSHVSSAPWTIQSPQSDELYGNSVCFSVRSRAFRFDRSDFDVSMSIVAMHQRQRWKRIKKKLKRKKNQERKRKKKT